MILDQDLNFKLHSNCIPVNGITRSVICDLHFHKYYLIPNALYEILVNHDGGTIKQIKQQYENQVDDIIDEYFNFLAVNELVFFDKYIDRFPPINLEWDEPALITNAIIGRVNNSTQRVNKDNLFFSFVTFF